MHAAPVECNLTSITQGDRGVAHRDHGPKPEALGSVHSTKKKKGLSTQITPLEIATKQKVRERCLTDRLRRKSICTEVATLRGMERWGGCGVPSVPVGNKLAETDKTRLDLGPPGRALAFLKASWELLKVWSKG